MDYKNLIYAFTCLSFSVVIGAAIYEHLSVVPQWSAAPPKSLTMFQGEYGLNPAPFWKLIHPVTFILFIVTLITSWKFPRKRNVLFVLISYALIIAATAVYFVPELMEITQTVYSQDIDTELTSRSAIWETLSLVRLAILVVLSIILFLGLARNKIITAEKFEN